MSAKAYLGMCRVHCLPMRILADRLVQAKGRVKPTFGANTAGQSGSILGYTEIIHMLLLVCLLFPFD